jgi:hypothetical protein
MSRMKRIIKHCKTKVSSGKYFVKHNKVGSITICYNIVSSIQKSCWPINLSNWTFVNLLCQVNFCRTSIYWTYIWMGLSIALPDERWNYTVGWNGLNFTLLEK